MLSTYVPGTVTSVRNSEISGYIKRKSDSRKEFHRGEAVSVDRREFLAE